MTEQDQPKPSRSQRWAKLGIVLILISGVLWFSTFFAVPFLPISTQAKFITGGVLFGGAQIAWWSGAALAGPETVKRIVGWFSRKKSPGDEPD